MTEKKLGRPPEPVPQDKADEIVNWLSSGRFLSEYCRQTGKPKRTTIYEWIEKDEAFAERVARARARGEEIMFESVLDIVDERPPLDMNGKTDAGFVAWQKSRAWTHLQMLAKMNPKKYGDKIDLNHNGSIGLNINIDLGDKEND